MVTSQEMVPLASKKFPCDHPTSPNNGKIIVGAENPVVANPKARMIS
jgi:hypothetical protein